MVVCFTVTALNTSSWGHSFFLDHSIAYNVLNKLWAALLVVKVLVDKHTAVEWAVIIVIGVLAFACCVHAHAMRPFELMMFVAAAKDCKPRRLAFCLIWPLAIILLLTVVFSFVGLSKNVESYRASADFVRSSLGFLNPNSFGLICLAVSATLAVLWWRRHPVLHLVISAVMLFAVTRVADSRGAAVGMILVIVVVIASALKAPKENGFGGRRTAIACFVVFLLLVVTSYSMMFWFDPSNSLLSTVDRLLSYRFSFGHGFYVLYPPTLFGFDVSQVPYQRVAPTYDSGFIVDNVFMLLPLNSGILITVIYLCSLVALYIKAIRERTGNAILVIMTALLVYAFIESYGAFLYINFCLMSLSALLYNQPLSSLNLPYETTVPEAEPNDSPDTESEEVEQVSRRRAPVKRRAPRIATRRNLGGDGRANRR